MAYKKLTREGENFITTICSVGGNNLLTGSNSYKLNFSSDPENTIYTALPKDRNGNIITTNAKLGGELIYWFNIYCEEYELDANIVAAQAFIESKYVLWAFPSPSLNSSAQGISQILSSTLYDIIIGNRGKASNVSTLFSNDEIDRITLGLTNPRSEDSYKYVNNTGGEDVAKSNRIKLFQNCMNNPDLMIKAQCRLVKGISIIAANNAASTLFGYNQGPSYVKSTFTATLKLAEGKLSKGRYSDGLEYVNRIFRVLGDKEYKTHKPSGIWFGYDIDFTFDEFKADVATSGVNINTVDKSTRLSKNYVLGDLITTSTGIDNNPDSQLDLVKLKVFANTILEPLNTHFNTRFIVNSSYRSDKVNSAVGGVISSQHKQAEAADIRVKTNNSNLLRSIYEEIISQKVVPYDQIIYETKGDSIPLRWIHISYKSEAPERNRFETKLATLVNGSMQYQNFTA